MSAQFRDSMFQQMKEDLVGPLRPDELLEDRPSDRYLTGILFPRRSVIPDEENEQLQSGEGEGEDTTDSAPEAIALNHVMRPAVAGISFAVKGEGEGDELPKITAFISCGTYTPVWFDEDGEQSDSPGPDYRAKWQRSDHDVTINGIELLLGAMPPIDLTQYELPGMLLQFQIARSPHCTTVTAVLVNAWDDAGSRLENEKRTFFQVELRIRAEGSASLVSRPSRKGGEEPEFQLIYRHCREFAAGHTCSAAWQSDENGFVEEVRTTWIPSQIVPAISADGDTCFAKLRETHLQPLSAEWLATAPVAQLTDGLRMIPDIYSGWLDDRENEVNSLPKELQAQAHEHLAVCRQASERMRDSILLLGSNESALSAFRYANRAMAIQRKWAIGANDLTWRPFQIAFQLLALESLANRLHPGREIMDLLWFPTGGGKTEAYLGLVAFVLFYRRIGNGPPQQGGGVGVIMRYTLRLLTIQQFQRAAALICACEHMRRGHERPEPHDLDLGEEAFSIGLWVGGGATPNSVEEAADRITTNSDPTPCQVKICPACAQETLEWEYTTRRNQRGREVPNQILVRCTNQSCPFGGSPLPHLPVWTVDEDIYREAPSLLIGTVDKFAQIARKPVETARFFGSLSDPPDLIIQDELHLISGPLGTIAGIYEIAIDELCAREVQGNGDILRIVPKIIGSTATIRRAKDQIQSLFARSTFQFPPPVLDAGNSCFAVHDLSAPGRLYAGITSAGRSPKFALQASCGSLMQAATALGASSDAERDPWWTQIVYFNSLRELGGALVMFQDDVPASIGLYARIRNHVPREVQSLDELTSRKTQIELRDTLHRLEKECMTGEAFDAVLASNMISVGVDVLRLSLMVVNGQPKQIAEYIQATSRVGRKHPGLIATVYNNGRARDRSHYETFSTWHAAPYRDVEATSVTPFASRAQDKALHAVLITLVRHRVSGLRERPVLTAALRQKIENEILPVILGRVAAIDPDESESVRRKLEGLLDAWEMRVSRWSSASTRPSYWWDEKPDRSLLMSAEQFAARAAAGWSNGEVWSTPNSMRDVEPGTPFKLLTRMRVGGQSSAS